MTKEQLIKKIKDITFITIEFKGNYCFHGSKPNGDNIQITPKSIRLNLSLSHNEYSELYKIIKEYYEKN